VIQKSRLRAMTVPEIEVEITRLKGLVKKAMGNHYPRIWGGEIGQLEAELLRKQTRKVVYVYWDDVSGSGYVWKLGYRRVYPDGKHGDGASMHSGVLAEFFKKHKITHVHSEFGDKTTSPECIKDGIHTVKTYLKWWRLSEQDD
jgi:hypothetical protein